MQNKMAKNRVVLIEDVCSVWDTKGVISEFDMLISGRVHGAVAGISQCVPTVIIDYGQEPKAHKLRGFARLVELEEYIANPGDSDDMLDKALTCWKKRFEIRNGLEERIPMVQELARQNLNVVREYLQENGMVKYERKC